jgi:hypothetical protein
MNNGSRLNDRLNASGKTDRLLGELLCSQCGRSFRQLQAFRAGETLQLPGVFRVAGEKQNLVLL